MEQAIGRIVTTHDYDYERLWLNFNLTDKKLLQTLCLNKAEEIRRLMPSSTFNSSAQRLMKRGYVIRTDRLELEDPFFRRWILGQMG